MCNATELVGMVVAITGDVVVVIAASIVLVVADGAAVEVALPSGAGGAVAVVAGREVLTPRSGRLVVTCVVVTWAGRCPHAAAIAPRPNMDKNSLRCHLRYR